MKRLKNPFIIISDDGVKFKYENAASFERVVRPQTKTQKLLDLQYTVSESNLKGKDKDTTNYPVSPNLITKKISDGLRMIRKRFGLVPQFDVKCESGMDKYNKLTCTIKDKFVYNIQEFKNLVQKSKKLQYNVDPYLEKDHNWSMNVSDDDVLILKDEKLWRSFPKTCKDKENPFCKDIYEYDWDLKRYVSK